MFYSASTSYTDTRYGSLAVWVTQADFSQRMSHPVFCSEDFTRFLLITGQRGYKLNQTAPHTHTSAKRMFLPFKASWTYVSSNHKLLIYCKESYIKWNMSQIMTVKTTSTAYRLPHIYVLSVLAYALSVLLQLYLPTSVIAKEEYCKYKKGVYIIPWNTVSSFCFPF